MSNRYDFAQRHPVLLAGLWFMLATFIVCVLGNAVFFCGATTSITRSDGMTSIILPSIAACMGGVVRGYRIIVPEAPIAGREAIRQGIATGFLSYLFYTVMALIMTLIMTRELHLMWTILIHLYGLVICSIPITLVGGAAGWGLHRFAERQGIAAERESAL